RHQVEAGVVPVAGDHALLDRARCKGKPRWGQRSSTAYAASPSHSTQTGWVPSLVNSRPVLRRSSSDPASILVIVSLLNPLQLLGNRVRGGQVHRTRCAAVLAQACLGQLDDVLVAVVDGPVDEVAAGRLVLA